MNVTNKKAILDFNTLKLKLQLISFNQYVVQFSEEPVLAFID